MRFLLFSLGSIFLTGFEIWPLPHCSAFSLSLISSFHGARLHQFPQSYEQYRNVPRSTEAITMRKQKASDRRTRRLQRYGGEQESLQIQQQVGFEALKILEELLACKLDSTGSNFFRQMLRLYKAAKLRLFLMPDPSKSINELEMVKN